MRENKAEQVQIGLLSFAFHWKFGANQWQDQLLVRKNLCSLGIIIGKTGKGDDLAI